MKGRPSRRFAALTSIGLLATAGLAQTPSLLADLGDPVRGEAAEIALLQRGADAVPLLLDLFTAWQDATPRDVERLRSALRVVDLLGAGHDQLAPVLRVRWRGLAAPLGVELLSAHASMHQMREPRREPLVVSRADVPVVGWQRAATQLLRSTLRSQATTLGRDQPGNLPASDQVFRRELAAETALLDADPAAAKALLARLRARDRPAQDASLLWNGIPLPIVDGFALKASLAVVHLSRKDPANAIAWAHIAAWHPHRSTALMALRATAAHGPANAAALPELLTVLDRGDPELTVEVLKILALTGEALAEALPTLACLAAAGDAEPHRLAARLVERADRQGLAPSAAARERQQRRTRVATMQALLQPPPADPAAVAARTTRLLADPESAWTALTERYLQDGPETADWLVHQLGEVGRVMPAATREAWRRAIASPGMLVKWQERALCNTRGVLSRPRALAYAKLTIGQPQLPALVTCLGLDNAAVRLVAAHALARRAAEVAAAGAEVHASLRRAFTAGQPIESVFDIRDGQTVTEPLDCGDAVRGAIAAALLDVAASPPQQAQQLQCLLAHDEADAVAVGVARWSHAAGEPLLFLASKDRRPAVAAAATAALAARGGR